MAGDRTAERAPPARENAGETVEAVPVSPPEIVKGSRAESVPMPISEIANPTEQVPEIRPSDVTEGPVQSPPGETAIVSALPSVTVAPRPEAPGDPVSRSERTDVPHVSIGRIDLIFEDPTPPAPRKRIAPDRTSGFDAYDRVRSGHRR